MKLPIHQLYLSYRDHKITKTLLKSKVSEMIQLYNGHHPNAVEKASTLCSTILSWIGNEQEQLPISDIYY